MKIKKVWKQEYFHDKPKSQNPTYCFFISNLGVSALLIILQSLLALYQLLLHKKATFTIKIVMACLTFNRKFRANTQTYPIFTFCFSVLWSSPVEQLIKNEVIMKITYHLLQWLSQNILRVIGKISFSFTWSLNFHDKSNLKLLLFCTAHDYNQAI